MLNYVDENQKNVRFAIDMTLLRGQEEPGIQWDDTCRNLLTVLDYKTHEYSILSPDRLPTATKEKDGRVLKYRYLDVPVKLHKDAVGIWQWLNRAKGGGSTLNIALSEAILDMRRTGAVSFNAWCEKKRREFQGATDE